MSKEEATLAKAGKLNDVNGFRDNKYGPFEAALTTYGSQTFVSALSFKGVFLTQFHPEKCGKAGLQVIRSFLNGAKHTTQTLPLSSISRPNASIANNGLKSGLTARIVACLDVRTNDTGDLVVTKVTSTTLESARLTVKATQFATLVSQFLFVKIL